MVMALLFATLLFRALTKALGEQTAWFLDLDKPLGPTSELVVICLWYVGIELEGEALVTVNFLLMESHADLPAIFFLSQV